MKFILRDDDACFFTDPTELESVHSPHWNKVPVSIACVPFLKGAKVGGGDRNPETSDLIYPLGDNMKLVTFLREQQSSGRVSVMLHGWSHENVEGEPEFVNGANLSVKVRDGLRYLEDVLQSDIRTFVPPHNSLSSIGTSAVARERLDIFMAFSHRPSERPFGIDNMANFMRSSLLFLRYRRRRRWPRPYRFRDHRELGSYLINRSTDISEIEEAFWFTHRLGGDFCLAIHYWEILRDRLQEKLRHIIQLAVNTPGVECVTDIQYWSS